MNSEMYIGEMQDFVEKINLCRKDEIMLFDDLKDVFNNIDECFNLKYKSLFKQKEEEFLEKYSTFIRIHENNILVINKNIDNYLSTSIDVANKFSQIQK